jgi:DNA-binding PadR family transcriptional regulator
MPRRPHTSKQALKLFAVLLSRDGEWVYGYDLCEACGVGSGTLYPLLVRLSERNLLEARWEESGSRGRPPRHLYCLTAEGRKLAHARLREFSPETSGREALA